MQITLDITHQEAEALRKTIENCLHLAALSPSTAAALNITQKDIERVGAVLRRMPEFLKMKEA